MSYTKQIFKIAAKFEEYSLTKFASFSQREAMEILGIISEKATDQEAKEAYDSLSLEDISKMQRQIGIKYHPDRYATRPEQEQLEAGEKFKKMFSAASFLKAEKEIFARWSSDAKIHQRSYSQSEVAEEAAKAAKRERLRHEAEEIRRKRHEAIKREEEKKRIQDEAYQNAVRRAQEKARRDQKPNPFTSEPRSGSIFDPLPTSSPKPVSPEPKRPSLFDPFTEEERKKRNIP